MVDSLALVRTSTSRISWTAMNRHIKTLLDDRYSEIAINYQLIMTKWMKENLKFELSNASKESPAY